MPAISAIFHKNNRIMADRRDSVKAEAVPHDGSVQPKGQHMGKKDILARRYFSDPERFAELINVSIYHGRKMIFPENLTAFIRKYPSLSGTSGEKERDILMKDRKRNICYGIEIETESDYSMPERVMVYDACEYEQQIKEIHKKHRERQDYKKYREWKSRMKKEDFLCPTLTVVLYLGEGHWEGRRTLSQMFRPSEMTGIPGKTGFPDYGYPLIEADFEDPKMYETDLKYFFQAMQCRKDKERLKALFQTEGFQNLDPETEQVIAVHLNMKKLVHKMKKEELPMCKAFDDLMKEERQNGKREGRAAGKKEEKLLIIRRMIGKGLDEKLIRELTKCTAKEMAEAGR